MIQLAIEIPYWGQSLLRVLGGLVAVLLPAAAHKLCGDTRMHEGGTIGSARPARHAVCVGGAARRRTTL